MGARDSINCKKCAISYKALTDEIDKGFKNVGKSRLLVFVFIHEPHPPKGFLDILGPLLII